MELEMEWTITGNAFIPQSPHSYDLREREIHFCKKQKKSREPTTKPINISKNN